MAVHLTPTELAEEIHMQRREVISRCMEMNVPIFNGRIDKTLFLSNLRRFGQRRRAPGSRLSAGPLTSLYRPPPEVDFHAGWDICPG